MAPGRLRLLLVAYAVVLAAGAAGVHLVTRVDPSRAADGVRIVSHWENGKRTARFVTAADAPLPDATCGKGCVRAVERVVDEGPLPGFSETLLGIALVPGRDGLKVTLEGRTVYATPDDLVVWGAAAGKPRLGAVNIKLGLARIDLAVAALARTLGTDPDTLRADGVFRRVVVRPDAADGRAPFGVPVPIDSITPKRLRRAVLLAGRYLARNTRKNGSMLYDVDLVTAETKPGYSYPRHAGATFFMAEVAAYSGHKAIRSAAVRAARYMRDRATAQCGPHQCVGTGRVVTVGSTALAVLAYVELTKAGFVDDYDDAIRAGVAFLRSQQRDDGEFMHFYDRVDWRPVDKQGQYYSGEATLALIHAYEVTGDPGDLEAARRALSYIVGPGWRFFGDRYIYAQEHWTCQAVEAIWKHAPDREALDFCLRYEAFGRSIQDPSGGYTMNPFHPARFTGAGSRTEAAVATLITAARAGVDAAQIERLDTQVRRGIAFLLSAQYDPGPTHLMSKPKRLFGGFPGSPVDLAVRIDMPQHAGAGMLRYMRYLEGR